MTQQPEDERQRLIGELLRIRQSIDAAWSIGLDDTTAAEALDTLVDLYNEAINAMLKNNESGLTIIQRVVNQAGVLAMKVWDGIAQQKRGEAKRAVTRDDLPADLTAAVRLYNEAEEKHNQAIRFSKKEDVSGLALYDEAVEKYRKALSEVLLIEQGTKGLRQARHEEVKTGFRLQRWQVYLAIIALFAAIILGIIGIRF